MQQILCTVAALPRHFASNYMVVVHVVVQFYHAVIVFIVLVFAHGVQLTVLHHSAVTDVLLSQSI